MADKAKILLALKQLDPDNADHWTDDGSPRASAVQALASDPNVKRADINAASPEFTRDAAIAAREAAAANTDPGLAKADAEKAAAEATDAPEFGNDAEARAFYAERISDNAKALDAARKAVVVAQALVNNKEAALQASRNDMQRRFPPLSVAENLKQHLARAAQNRADAAGGGAKSQIDLAMSRGNSRGWKRPTRTMSTEPNAGTGA